MVREKTSMHSNGSVSVLERFFWYLLFFSVTCGAFLEYINQTYLQKSLILFCLASLLAFKKSYLSKHVLSLAKNWTQAGQDIWSLLRRPVCEPADLLLCILVVLQFVTAFYNNVPFAQTAVSSSPFLIFIAGKFLFNSTSLPSKNNLSVIYWLFLLQVFVVAIKFMVFGVNEHTLIGTFTNNVGEWSLYMSSLLLLGAIILLPRSQFSTVLMIFLGAAFIGLVGEKRTVPFLLPFMLVVLYPIYKKENRRIFFRKQINAILSALIVFLFGITLIPSLNPSEKYIKPHAFYSLAYVFKYITRDSKIESLQSDSSEVQSDSSEVQLDVSKLLVSVERKILDISSFGAGEQKPGQIGLEAKIDQPLVPPTGDENSYSSRLQALKFVPTEVYEKYGIKKFLLGFGGGYFGQSAFTETVIKPRDILGKNITMTAGTRAFLETGFIGYLLLVCNLLYFWITSLKKVRTRVAKFQTAALGLIIFDLLFYSSTFLSFYPAILIFSYVAMKQKSAKLSHASLQK